MSFSRLYFILTHKITIDEQNKISSLFIVIITLPNSYAYYILFSQPWNALFFRSTLLRTLILLVSASFGFTDCSYQFQSAFNALATKRRWVLTSYILIFFPVSTENMTIITTQAADKVCWYPSICWFSWDYFGVVILYFYLVAAPEQSSHHIFLWTRLVSTNILILSPIEKALLVLFSRTILLPNSNTSTGSTIIKIQPITKLWCGKSICEIFILRLGLYHISALTVTFLAWREIFH